MKAFFYSAVVGASLLSATSVAWAGDSCHAAASACHRTKAKDIVDTAVSAGTFKTLAAALQAAGLVDTLKGKGPFTVFAPTDEAFSIGCRGARTTAAIAEAREKLVAWIDQKKGEYVSAGPMRIMGYNSPFVPRDRNFFEVQIPVKVAKADRSKVEDRSRELESR
jgi:hypothetical protein